MAIEESRRVGLYQASIHSKIAPASWSQLSQSCSSSSSCCRVEKKLSAAALSKQSPMVPVGAGNSIVVLTSRYAVVPLCRQPSDGGAPRLPAPSACPCGQQLQRATSHVGSNRRRRPVGAISSPTLRLSRNASSTSTNSPTTPSVSKARQRGSAPESSLPTFDQANSSSKRSSIARHDRSSDDLWYSTPGMSARSAHGWVKLCAAPP